MMIKGEEKWEFFLLQIAHKAILTNHDIVIGLHVNIHYYNPVESSIFSFSIPALLLLPKN